MSFASLRHRAAVGWAALAISVCLAAPLAGCAPVAGVVAPASAVADPTRDIIVAVADAPEAIAPVGGNAHGLYAGPSGAAGYAGSARAAALAAEVAAQHGLQETARWTIASLQLRCMLYRLPEGSDRAAVLARLRQDPRVQLAQALNEFRTLDTPGAPPSAGAGYDDPYYPLQHGLASIHAAEAQLGSRGEGVTVALVDTGIDGNHPDLRERVDRQRDHVGAAQAAAAGGERHATEVAGIVAATANNRVGIVGVAPRARLRSYRACWPVADGTARCNSFTLAQALGAAIADGNDVINLSLGGPADPLLGRLTARALAAGTVVVGALPPDGALDGFPVGVPGVLAVASAETVARDRRVLLAPGRDILSLEPGGGYGYASGSSLAAAHVSGAAAVLLALEPGLRGEQLHEALAPADAAPGAVIDLCRAVQRLRPGVRCPRVE